MSEGGNVIAEAQKRALEIAAKLTASAGSYANGDENSRKRPLEDNSADAPDTKKSFTDGFSQQDNAKLIAQAAISKITGQLGLAQSLTIEIKVPNRMVGLIIGRQGEMINKLQADSGAKIQVAPDGSEINGERQVSISGSPDTVEKAKMLVNAVIEEAGGVTSVAMMNLEPGQEVIELMIPANKVGLIIGKGGEMIKMLQERAGCKMQMIQDGPFANTPEKPLRMTGFQENCKKARQLVLDLMDQKEMEVFNSLVSDMSPGLLELQVPKALVGFIIGRNGENIVNIQNSCQVKLQFHNEVPGCPYRMATISGEPPNCQKAQAIINDMISEVRDVSLQRQQTGIKPRIELPDPQGPQVQTVGYSIPANKCGLIIGKGGDTIRQLMVQSNCFIELDRGPSPNPQEKLFNIRGMPQQIKVAQDLIKQKIEGGGLPGIDPYANHPALGLAASALFQGQMGGGQQGNPWGQYAAAYGGYPGYGGSPGQQQQQQQQQPSNAEAAQAWAAYYQQLQAYTQQQQQGGAGQQPQATPTSAGGQPSAELQAQWAEYYRQMGYMYGGGAGGQQQPPANNQMPLPPSHPDQKILRPG